MPNAPVATPQTANPVRMLVPPDERFWKRYSPHHEAPLSGVSSFALHLLLIPLLLLIGWVKTKLHDEDENRSASVDVVRIKPGGGGGSKSGVGGGQGDLEPGGKESGGDEQPKDRQLPPDDPPKEIPVAKRQGIQQEFKNDPHAERLLREGTQAFHRLADMDRDVRKQLRKNVNPGLGQGGTGSGGGMGGGKDKGIGDARGGGEAALNQREKRVLRWAMTFSTQNGNDYLNQLHGLGAIVAIPQDGDRFLVIRDLKNPRAGKIEDLSSINRIYWVDNKPQSVTSLSQALGLSSVPPLFAAFFPESLEKKLFAREMAALREKYGATKGENDIHETRFSVERRGGVYDVRVMDITLR